MFWCSMSAPLRQRPWLEDSDAIAYKSAARATFFAGLSIDYPFRPFLIYNANLFIQVYP